jgi:hypothetical protein
MAWTWGQWNSFEWFAADYSKTLFGRGGPPIVARLFRFHPISDDFNRHCSID